jgi:hypothetical protein
MIGKIFDSAGIFLAAVLTLCGFLLLFLPWKQALNIPDAPAPKPTSGEVYVTVDPAAKVPGKPALPAVRPK